MITTARIRCIKTTVEKTFLNSFLSFFPNEKVIKRELAPPNEEFKNHNIEITPPTTL